MFFSSMVIAYAQPAKKEEYKIVSIDTVGLYYLLLVHSKDQKKDTISVLSLIDQLSKPHNVKKGELLKVGKYYHMKLYPMNRIRVSSDTNIVSLVNLRGYYVDDKELLKPGKLPYYSNNLYKNYYFRRPDVVMQH